MNSANERKFAMVLVAIDGSDLSMKASKFAIDFAKKYASKLFAINVRQIPVGALYASTVGPVGEIIEQQEMEIERCFAEIRKKSADANLELHTETIGHFKSVYADLVEYSERENIDLIVIGSRGKTGFVKLLLGSVASGVVTYARCPVMVIK